MQVGEAGKGEKMVTFQGVNLWFEIDGRAAIVRVYDDLSYTLEINGAFYTNEALVAAAIAERLTEWVAGHLRPPDDEEDAAE